jgi:hypothetical protein
VGGGGAVRGGVRAFFTQIRWNEAVFASDAVRGRFWPELCGPIGRAGFPGAFERARKEGKLGRWLAGKEGARGGDLAGMALTALLLAGGIGAIASIHPRELSYFNCLVGGLEGADRKGFEVSYWGEALNEKVIADLNATLPQGARVKTLSFHGLAPVILQEWGYCGKTSASIRPRHTTIVDAVS